jgi:hypothetical protein
MANLDFFATRADHEALVRFLFGSTDIRVFESYSEFGRELREFRSFEELAAAFEVGSDPAGSGFAVLLQLWSPSVESGPRMERITLDPSRCGGHTFRYRIDGGGLIQLYFGGISGRTITKSHYGHFSEAGARKWGRSEGWTGLHSRACRTRYSITFGVAWRSPWCPVGRSLPKHMAMPDQGTLSKRRRPRQPPTNRQGFSHREADAKSLVYCRVCHVVIRQYS